MTESRAVASGTAAPVLAGPLFRLLWWAWLYASRMRMRMDYMNGGTTATAAAAVAPHQPLSFNFPKCPFGKQKIVYRSCQPCWFTQWSFLHYDESKDAVFCQTCLKGFKQKKMRTSSADPAFVSQIVTIILYIFLLVCYFLFYVQ